MMQLRNTPDPHPPVMPALRAARWIGRTIRYAHLEPALSWLGWIVSVVVFALWTRFHYRAPAGPAWIGMTIHTTVFAIWLLVVREWLLIRLLRRRGQHLDQDGEDPT